MGHQRFTTLFSFLLIGAILFLGACTQGSTTTETVHEEVHWGYTGEAAPENWGELSPEFVLCAEGLGQSPIDIVDSQASAEDLPALSFNYQPIALNEINNGHTLQVNYSEGSFIEANGTRYDLLQFHFHAPSEHTLNGQNVAMEMHLVHRSAEGKLAVVGVMINPGDVNHAYDLVWDYMPANNGDTREVSTASINANDLLPAERSYYHYVGSLTTPPCSEGVEWYVLTTPVLLSEGQIASFKAIMNNNNRPVQALNDRSIEVDTTP